ncbi:hypothetical protein Sros01_03380 [Streptomyces roseochromogenus]|nr:hypothetical protein Sros01_03380 [Streptomyces roseochromogenus]
MTDSATYHLYAIEGGSGHELRDDGPMPPLPPGVMMFDGLSDGGGTFALSVIDPVAGELLGTATVEGRRPAGMVAHPDGSRLYIPARSESEGFVILVVATESLTVTAEIEMPGEAGHLTVSADGSRLYAVTSWEGAVTEIDTTAGKVTRTIESVTDDLGHLAVSADGRCLYGGLSRDRNLAVRATILAQGAAGEAVDFSGRAHGPSGVKLLPSFDGTRLYAFHGFFGTLAALDARTLAVTARYDNGGEPAKDIALSPDGNHLYVLSAEGESQILHPTTLKETGRFPADGSTIIVSGDGTLCVKEYARTYVLLSPGTDPKQRREIRVPHDTGTVVAGAPTAWRPPPAPPARSYPARFKRDGYLYNSRPKGFMPGNSHEAGDGVPVPATPEVIKGRYARGSGGQWASCAWPLGSYKHFYKIPEWSDAYVDEDDIESA